MTTMTTVDACALRGRVRILLVLFVVGLVISGATAIPLTREAEVLQRMLGEGSAVQGWCPALAAWISRVYRGITETGRDYPFIFYGTDWLAFGHFVIAIAFLGPIRNPVRNRWVIEFGMIACALVIPWALIFGPIRGIPFFWRLIDCSFGVVGIIPLYLARRYTRLMMDDWRRSPSLPLPSSILLLPAVASPATRSERGP